MSSKAKILECLRDAWQALPKVMPAKVKAEYTWSLIADVANFTRGVLKA